MHRFFVALFILLRQSASMTVSICANSSHVPSPSLLFPAAPSGPFRHAISHDVKPNSRNTGGGVPTLAGGTSIYSVSPLGLPGHSATILETSSTNSYALIPITQGSHSATPSTRDRFSPTHFSKTEKGSSAQPNRDGPSTLNPSRPQSRPHIPSDTSVALPSSKIQVSPSVSHSTSLPSSGFTTTTEYKHEISSFEHRTSRTHVFLPSPKSISSSLKLGPAASATLPKPSALETRSTTDKSAATTDTASNSASTTTPPDSRTLSELPLFPTFTNAPEGFHAVNILSLDSKNTLLKTTENNHHTIIPVIGGIALYGISTPGTYSNLPGVRGSVHIPCLINCSTPPSGGGGGGGNENLNDNNDDDDSTRRMSKATSQSVATDHSRATTQPTRASSCTSATTTEFTNKIIQCTPVATNADKSSTTIIACRTSADIKTASACDDFRETAAVSTTTIAPACKKPVAWANVVDGDDFPIYHHFRQMDKDTPGGKSSTSVPEPTTNSFSQHRQHGASVPLRLVTSTSVPQLSGASSPVPRRTGPSRSVPLITSIIPANRLSTLLTANVPTTTPSCMADGAPWFSPTSWCDCGPNATYSTLPTTSGAMGADCAYKSLPESTIQPMARSVAPTNIPGRNGVPGCAVVASSDGTSAYCNCAGTPAPTLSPTVDGLLNCAYTVQPTNFYDPVPPTTVPTLTPSPYASGQCNVHIWEFLGQNIRDPEVGIDVKITDADGNAIGDSSGSLDWGQTLETKGELPWILQVTPQMKNNNRRRSLGTYIGKRFGGGPIPMRPLYEHGPVDFAYASQKWDTSSSQCSVGDWDNGNAKDFFGSLIFRDKFLPNRQIDCKFDCPAPAASSQKRDEHKERDKRGQENVNHDPSPTTNQDPSSIDDHLFEMRDALDRRTNHGAAWVRYAPSGARYYKAWQEKTGEDVFYQCNFDDDFIFDPPVKRVQPVRGIRPVLEEAGYGVSKDYYAITAVGPKDHPIADFTNTISASQGVFLANANNRGALPSDPTHPHYDGEFPNGRAPIPWRFSSIAWEMWKRTVLTENPNWAADPSQADYSGIKSFWRREIDNPDTVSILDEAFTDKNTHSVQTWYPTNPNQDTNPFWALLGSPNGNGIQYFLMDNKVALKGKGIVSISATTIGDGLYTMWATFG